MDETLATLEEQYCPPIDPALLSAILSDFDLSQPDALQSARTTLDALKESALLEEKAGFDASGTGGVDENACDEFHGLNGPGTSAAHSEETVPSVISSKLSSISLKDDTSETNDHLDDLEHLEQLDQSTKCDLLEALFGTQISRQTIENTLQRCNGKWSTAMEELLNQVYFSEQRDDIDIEAASAKGIDGFFGDTPFPRGRKGKARSKALRNSNRRRTSSLSDLPDNDSIPVTNKWKSASADIDFISLRTGIKTATISSMYYEAGASLPKTIIAVIHASREESKYVVTDGVAVSRQASELGREFPDITLEDLTVLTRLAHPSVAAARELASALTSNAQIPMGDLRIVPHYSRPSDIETTLDWNSVAKKPRSAASSPRPSMENGSASAHKDVYDLARAAAFSQARAARQKAKSNHLMSGAAHVYSEKSREYAALSSKASARAADELVTAQSTTSQVDLHGVDVLNAVRIAQQKVDEWWASLGESRVNGRIGAEDRQAGFRIIVGVGRHSEGGKGKLGPAVTKSLKAQGWRVEPAGGAIIVKGPLRR